MYLQESRKVLKNGKELIIRSARKEDALAMINYMKLTAIETPFLLREPEEIEITKEQEEEYLQRVEENPNEIMLAAFLEGEHVGNCSLMAYGRKRYRHKCGIAIALYQKYCGRGIGRAMLDTVLKIAKESDYEQALLEVVASNEAAIHLYESLGFETYGTEPNAMKYKDGTYADLQMMMRKL